MLNVGYPYRAYLTGLMPQSLGKQVRNLMQVSYLKSLADEEQ